MADAKHKVYYLSHYNNPAVTGEDRVVSFAATTKMDYVCDVLVRLGYEVEIISMAPPAGPKACPGGIFDLRDGVTLRLFPALPKSTKMNGALNVLRLRRDVSRFLGGLVPGDTVLCYHSLLFCGLLEKAKERVRFRLVLEVEELYSDVTGSNADLKREEKLFRHCDAFVFPTAMLARTVGAGERPYAICSGIYQANERVVDRRDDGRVHVVYAGTLDPRKGGAAAAVAAGAMLDGRYALHILGGGYPEWVAAIEETVAHANVSGRGCNVSYEGLKSGREFDAFVQSCHIGLSSQNPDAEFNSTSFPSKVFMYLSNGLSVVSVDLPVFTGEIRNALTICQDNAPETLARAIEAAPKESRASELLRELDDKFCVSLGLLLQ